MRLPAAGRLVDKHLNVGKFALLKHFNLVRCLKAQPEVWRCSKRFPYEISHLGRYGPPSMNELFQTSGLDEIVVRIDRRCATEVCQRAFDAAFFSFFDIPGR